MKYLAIFLFALSLLVSCSDNGSNPAENSKFAGNWVVSVAGDEHGDYSFSIDSNGGINLSDVANQLKVTGSVNSNGNLNVSIYVAETLRGTGVGNLTETSGSGTWQSSVNGYTYDGTWTAVKQ
jgi:hypothetical protein